MSNIYEYHIFCETDNKWETTFGMVPPTTCPVNTSHIVRPNSASIKSVINSSTVQILEENIPTNGKYATKSVIMEAGPGETSTEILSLRVPITVLSAFIQTRDEHEGDSIDVYISENTTVGVITDSITAKEPWVSSPPQNYVTGEEVYYDGENYICMIDTVNNEPPSNTIHWRKVPFVIPVSSTVIDNTITGLKVRLVGTTIDDLDIITNKGDPYGSPANISTITTSKAPTNNYSAYTTYVQITAFFADNFTFGWGSRYSFATTKIGGSHLPANVPVTFKYKNNSTSGAPKRITVQIDYLQ